MTDYEEWQIMVEVLSVRLLWDRDFEDEELYADSSPEHADMLKNLMMVQDNYFLGIAPDPSPDEMPQIIGRLNGLMGEGWRAGT